MHYSVCTLKCITLSAPWSALLCVHLEVYYFVCILKCITLSAPWSALLCLHLEVHYFFCILKCITLSTSWSALLCLHIEVHYSVCTLKCMREGMWRRQLKDRKHNKQTQKGNIHRFRCTASTGVHVFHIQLSRVASYSSLSWTWISSAECNHGRICHGHDLAQQSGIMFISVMAMT